VLKAHKLFNGKFEKKDAGWVIRTLCSCFGGHYGVFRNWEEIQNWANEVAEDLKKPREEQQEEEGGN
jgi:hypothetical protein